MADWRGERTQRWRCLHEKVDAVFFEGDGVGLGLGHALNHFNVFDIELQ